MALTKPPLNMIQTDDGVGYDIVVGDQRTPVAKEYDKSTIIYPVDGGFDEVNGIFELMLNNGTSIKVAGFLTSSSVGTGPKGDPGDDGRDGREGKPGQSGRDGKDGVQGIQGEQGSLGPQGEQGIQGE
ncbi:MAG: hypothetical protein EBQ77_00155, partial [Sphingobacteriia bacterium]|nr:hypothetical protein [Sphingobacteriia bacterium]